MSSIRGAVVITTAALGVACQADLPEGVPTVTATTWESHEPYFPIATGKHEAIDCNKCHGDYDSFRDFTCIGCHVHSQAETDPPHTGVSNYTYERKSCFTCHPRGDATGVDHERLFPIGAGAIHEAQACRDCHVVPDDRSQVSCIDCHDHDEAPMQVTHAAIAGYAWATTACLGCHPSGEATPVDHTLFFPIGAGTTHEPLDCSSCHTIVADPTQVSCIDCHDHDEAPMQQQHDGIPGYEWQTPACLSCHRDGEGLSREAHDVIFPVSEATAHAVTECAGCHDNPTNRQDVTCIDCHAHETAPTATEHGPVGGYRYETGLCLKCHYDASVPRVADHQPFRIDERSKHKPEDAECLRCHPGEQPARPFPAADFEVFDCLGCHLRGEMDDKHSDEARYQYTSTSCVQSGCHPDGVKRD